MASDDQLFASPAVVTDQVVAIVEPGASFEGNLKATGVIHVNGEYKGTIETPDTLIFGPKARMSGTVKAGVVVIYGHVEAQVVARHRIEMKKPAIFKGEITAPSLQVEEGVLFEGSSSMG